MLTNPYLVLLKLLADNGFRVMAEWCNCGVDPPEGTGRRYCGPFSASPTMIVEGPATHLPGRPASASGRAEFVGHGRATGPRHADSAARPRAPVGSGGSMGAEGTEGTIGAGGVE